MEGGDSGLAALTGRIEERELTQEMRSSYLDYAMSVIVGRALPDVRDGLKPVHRRVLYAMHDLGLQPNRGYRKSAFVVGEVMAKYHPHSDASIYDTLVRLAQDFALRYPLVDGQGNFGSIDDDPAAAMRYTEARLARLATEMLRDIDADTVDFGPNYDETSKEPIVLPSRFPNLLVNGATGIAVGMATNIPPHNLTEIAGATRAYIENPDIDLAGLMEHVKGPDFPGGGLMSAQGIRDAFASGRGSVKVRARAHVEPHPRRQGRDHHLRASLHGQKGRRGRPDHEDRRPRTREEDHRDLRPARRVRPLRHADRDRAEARRRSRGRGPQPALQAHAAAELVRDQHGRARRRRAADARAEGADRPLRRPPARGRHPPHPVRAAPGRGPGARPRGHPDRARQPRRGHRADPRLRRSRDGPRRADGEVQPLGDPGAGDPRHAPPAPDRARVRQGTRGAQ